MIQNSVAFANSDRPKNTGRPGISETTCFQNIWEQYKTKIGLGLSDQSFPLAQPDKWK
jgi:hypothetical protein